MAFFECMIGSSGDGATLTVICYSGFAGSTISITNGVDTYSDVCPSSSPYEVVFSGLTNGTWTLSGIYNGTTYTKTLEVNTDVEFYPTPIGSTATPTNDIQTWLHCANIWNKSYTINQVLADTSTLLALISSNNAADYMARSTNWASSVCANATAMGYIGNNDYCANKLLADSTWLNAICNSTYFESVLNVKVPTMTSNTTPYGVASATSTQSGYDAYKAFDGVNSDSNAFIASGATNILLSYAFTNSILPKMVKFTPRAVGDSTNYLKDYEIRGSNNNFAAYDILATGTNPRQGGEITEVLATNNYYLALGLFVKNTYGGNVGVKELQFYGRA